MGGYQISLRLLQALIYPLSLPRRLGKSIHETNNIYINESLTFHRKRLFGKVNEFKRRSKWKYVWTVNGKIYLRESENTRAYDFNSIDQFESFLGQFE